jgi:hypothetical protein
MSAGAPNGGAETGEGGRGPEAAPQPRTLVAAAEQMQDLERELSEKPAPDPHVDLFGEDDDMEASSTAANTDILLYPVVSCECSSPCLRGDVTVIF